MLCMLLLLLLMKLLLMKLLLLLELHLLLISMLLLLYWMWLERSLSCLLPLLELHAKAIFRGGLWRLLMLLDLTSGIDGSWVLVTRCSRVLPMVGQSRLLLLLDLLLKSRHRGVDLVLLRSRRTW